MQFTQFIHFGRHGATAVLAASLTLGGCAGFASPWPAPAPIAAPAASPAPSAEPPTTAAAGDHALSDADRAEVRRLLRSAGYAVADGQLTDPPAYSALSFYDRVLLIDPQNPEARYGIQGVVDRLVELALRAADRRQFADAQSILARALLVDPGHPGIRPALTQIQLLQSARRDVYRLDPGALDARSAVVLATLREAGQASRSPGCRAVIRARSDAEGRWIYQEMSAAPGRDRIRAELLIAGSPSIENVCFPGAE